MSSENGIAPLMDSANDISAGVDPWYPSEFRPALCLPERSDASSLDPAGMSRASQRGHSESAALAISGCSLGVALDRTGTCALASAVAYTGLPTGSTQWSQCGRERLQSPRRLSVYQELLQPQRWLSGNLLP